MSDQRGDHGPKPFLSSSHLPLYLWDQVFVHHNSLYPRISRFSKRLMLKPFYFGQCRFSVALSPVFGFVSVPRFLIRFGHVLGSLFGHLFFSAFRSIYFLHVDLCTYIDVARIDLYTYIDVARYGSVHVYIEIIARRFCPGSRLSWNLSLYDVLMAIILSNFTQR